MTTLNRNAMTILPRRRRKRKSHRSTTVVYQRIGLLVFVGVSFLVLFLDSASRISESLLSLPHHYDLRRSGSSSLSFSLQAKEPSTTRQLLIQDISEEQAHFPLSGTLRSFSSGRHHPFFNSSSLPTTTTTMDRPRQCLCLLASPDGMSDIQRTLQAIALDEFLSTAFDECIHLTIHDRAMRYAPEKVFDQDGDLLPYLTHDPRFIVHRLWYHGGLTQFMGPTSLERLDDTTMVFASLSKVLETKDQIRQLIQASTTIDDQAFWCMEGEILGWNPSGTFGADPIYYKHNDEQVTWSNVDVCRKGPILMKGKHFNNRNGFLWNYTDYSCPTHEYLRWLSFQVERQGYPILMKRDDALARNFQYGGMAFPRACAQAWFADQPTAYAAFRQSKPSN